MRSLPSDETRNFRLARANVKTIREREQRTEREREREEKKDSTGLLFPTVADTRVPESGGSLAAAKYPGIGVESSANRRLSQFPGVPTRLNFYRRCRSTSSSTGGGGGLPLVVDGRWPIVSRDIG